ncbi:MlaE family lipid ABC transporter permease subunit [Pontiellaceae bacterium B12227]|nr:MlaE family lipid ABC transporter permease subunit [Pontiellaceae bacterium B12227]
MKLRAPQTNASCEESVQGGALILKLSGRLDARSVPELWPSINHAFKKKQIESVTIHGAGISYCDGTGAALLVHVRKSARLLGIDAVFQDLNSDVADLMALFPVKTIARVPEEKGHQWGDLVERIGEAFYVGLVGLGEHVSFLGELVSGLFKTLIQPGRLRVRDLMVIIEAAGPRALPIVGMLGFLIGLIIAFQGAILMKQFGAEIYVADSAGLLMARELGPLITAIIVAGRTGSAFAAEIGTMKVNEEIDAFSTMGLDPVRFLVIPRVLAASVMTPLLSVFAILFGLAGGAVVMLSMGYPLVTYVNRVIEALSPADYLGGLFKALVFGFLVAASGCLCGLRTGDGASAVGTSATRAVVSSIMLIVLADGIFAVLFFYLGI